MWIGSNKWSIAISTLFFFLSFLRCTPAPKIAGQFTEAEYQAMAKKMSRGNVPDISIDALRLQADQYLLLDTRTKEEYEVSHIPEAKWAGYKKFDIDDWKDVPRDRPIVTYCSVGYRSERIGEQLIEAGFTQVYNLRGSLFHWVNKGFPIENAQGNKTQKVHGYNKKWSKWLKVNDITY